MKSIRTTTLRLKISQISIEIQSSELFDFSQRNNPPTSSGNSKPSPAPQIVQNAEPVFKSQKKKRTIL